MSNRLNEINISLYIVS